MNGKTCATSDVAKAWDSIDWNKAEAYVKKLQMRIVKAHQQGRTGKVKSLQWLLTHSFYGRALAVSVVQQINSSCFLQFILYTFSAWPAPLSFYLLLFVHFI